MRRRWCIGILILLLFAPFSAGQNPSSAESVRIELSRARELPASLTEKIGPVVDEMLQRFDRRAAMDVVTFMSGYWRLAGSAGYDASVDRVRATLVQSGFADGKDSSQPSLWVEETRGQGRGWDHTAGTLAIVRNGQPDEIVLSKANERLALCINSFSTTPGGIVVPLIDAGRGDRPEDYAGRDVKGAVVLGDADANRLWRAATERGAIGIVSTSLAAYVNPQPAGAAPKPRDQWDILQWSSIPYDESRKGFGFKATPRAASTLRKALLAGPVRVRVEVASTFSNAPERTLIAEIPGRSHPGDRIVIAAHVQEPGANDNASGVATLQEMARGLVRSIREGKIA